MSKNEVKHLLEEDQNFEVIEANHEGKVKIRDFGTNNIREVDFYCLLAAAQKLHLQYQDEDAINLIADDIYEMQKTS